MSKRTLLQKKFHFIQEEREREKTGILQKLLPTYTQGNWETEGISKNERLRERERETIPCFFWSVKYFW